MAFSFALIKKTARQELYEVSATADADTGGDVDHTLGTVPVTVTLTPICTTCRIALWVALGITADKITLSKTTLAGSSNPAAPVLRVLVEVDDEQIR